MTSQPSENQEPRPASGSSSAQKGYRARLQRALRPVAPPSRADAGHSRRVVASTIVQLLMLLLLLLLIAAATGRSSVVSFPWSSTTPTKLDPLIPNNSTSGIGVAGAAGADGTDSASGAASASSGPYDQTGPCTLDANLPPVDPRFEAFYNQRGGVEIFGRPVTKALQAVDGRAYQWFERARLELWPEYANAGYGVMSGRLGARYTSGVSFGSLKAQPVSPDVRYFPETGQTVGTPFLQFWEARGGLDLFGLPLSGVVQERLDDNKIYSVQYFERVRLELHPAGANPPDGEVQVGLLGRAFCLKNSKPDIIAPTAQP